MKKINLVISIDECSLLLVRYCYWVVKQKHWTSEWEVMEMSMDPSLSSIKQEHIPSINNGRLT